MAAVVDVPASRPFRGTGRGTADAVGLGRTGTGRERKTSVGPDASSGALRADQGGDAVASATGTENASARR
jgi:hypothetical protein